MSRIPSRANIRTRIPAGTVRLLAGVILAAIVAACHGGVSTAPEGAGPLGKFDKVWQDYDEHYAYFELGAIDWTALRAKYRPQVTDETSDADVARVIGAMIGELRDYHADLTTPYGVFGAPPVPYGHHYAPDVLEASYFAAPFRHTPSGRIGYARLGDGTGYVHIGSFQGSGWGPEIETAIGALGGVPALVIDIRDNGGGDEGIAQEVASRFYDMKRDYRTARFRTGPSHGDFGPATSFAVSPAGQRFTGPVALITNRYNGSAAEEFTLMLRILPTVVTVGDTTLGVGSNPLRVSLSNGWTYRIPQSIQATPDGMVYQWRGLPPAIPVAWTDADTAGGRDPYLDAAMAELRRRRGS